VKRVTIAAAITLAYAWWITGIASFTWLSYTLIAIPCLVAVALYAASGAYSPRRTETAPFYQRGERGPSRVSVVPWLVVFFFAVVLEAVGLAHGGRSKEVATLSTTVDHLLVTHAGRGVLFLAWLAAGATPLWRRWRRRRARAH
jgi:hypothetical protein